MASGSTSAIDDRQGIDRQGIQVIARAAAVLRSVGEEPRGLSLGEIASRLDLARSTVQRIVSALVEEGLLISAGPRAGVTLGPAIVRLAAAAIVDTERLVRPVLQSLSAALGETVDLSVLRGDQAVFVDQVVGSSRLVATSAIGEAFPLHCTANGKALLAHLPADRRDHLLDATRSRSTPSARARRDAVDDDLAEVTRTGLAWDIEEHAEGVCAVGACFSDRLGRDFAISVPVPAARFAAKREAIGAALLAAITEIRALVASA